MKELYGIGNGKINRIIELEFCILNLQQKIIKATSKTDLIICSTILSCIKNNIMRDLYDDESFNGLIYCINQISLEITRRMTLYDEERLPKLY